MSGLLLVARRELGAYLNSLWGYLVAAIMLVIDGLLFNAFALGKTARYSSDVLEDFFYFSFGTTVITAVLLTMRLLAEERQTGTIVLVDSSPLSDWQIVGGKFLSALVFLGGVTFISLYMPALIFVNGKVSVAHIASGNSGTCFSRSMRASAFFETGTSGGGDSKMIGSCSSTRCFSSLTTTSRFCATSLPI